MCMGMFWHVQLNYAITTFPSLYKQAFIDSILLLFQKVRGHEITSTTIIFQHVWFSNEKFVFLVIVFYIRNSLICGKKTHRGGGSGGPLLDKRTSNHPPQWTLFT